MVTPLLGYRKHGDTQGTPPLLDSNSSQRPLEPQLLASLRSVKICTLQCSPRVVSREVLTRERPSSNFTVQSPHSAAYVPSRNTRKKSQSLPGPRDSTLATSQDTPRTRRRNSGPPRDHCSCAGRMCVFFWLRTYTCFDPSRCAFAVCLATLSMMDVVLF